MPGEVAQIVRVIPLWKPQTVRDERLSAIHTLTSGLVSGGWSRYVRQQSLYYRRGHGSSRVSLLQRAGGSDSCSPGVHGDPGQLVFLLSFGANSEKHACRSFRAVVEISDRSRAQFRPGGQWIPDDQTNTGSVVRRDMQQRLLSVLQQWSDIATETVTLAAGCKV